MSPAPVIAPAATRKILIADRRAAQRYPIGLDLLYLIRLGKQDMQPGVAHTHDISSSGVSFHAGRLLPAGASIELSLNWPYLLQNSCPLQLIIQGRVVRSDEHATAVQTMHYEFRTRGLRSFRRAFAHG
jgi:hypothetical protein